jgi:uncharacterized membrane protein
MKTWARRFAPLPSYATFKLPPAKEHDTRSWLATIFHFWRNDGFRITPGAWRYSTLAALALAAAFITLLHGLAAGPASVLVPVAQMSFVFTALIGAVLFHERLDWRKRSGLAVAVLALALFAIS